MKTIKLDVLEREWLKLWLRHIERNPHSKIEFQQVKEILEKLEESKWVENI